MNLRNLLFHTAISINANAYRSEDLYDTFYGKQNANYKPVVHLSDGIEDSYLHFAQHEPNLDPYIKQEAFDPAHKVKETKVARQKPDVDVTYVFVPQKQHEQPVTKVEELIHQLGQPEHHDYSNDKALKPVFPWEGTDHTTHTAIETPHPQHDFSHWTLEDYKLYEAMQSQAPSY